MVVIYAFFVPDPEEDEEATSHAHGQAKNIEGAIAFVFPQVAEGDFQEIFLALWRFDLKGTREWGECCMGGSWTGAGGRAAGGRGVICEHEDDGRVQAAGVGVWADHFNICITTISVYQKKLFRLWKVIGTTNSTNMRRIFTVILGFTSLTLLFSCSSSRKMSNYVPFTRDLRQKLEKENIDLKQVQFYVDQKLILNRNLGDQKLVVNSGVVKTGKWEIHQ